MNRQIVLASRPKGVPGPENFVTLETALPEPGEAQVLLRHTWLGLAPAARLRMGENTGYRHPLALGEVVNGQAIGQVLKSRSTALNEGDTVMSMSGGWQQYSKADADDLVKVDLSVAAPNVWLGALGTSGMTAYMGLLVHGQPRAGETVVVSAATGGVGSAVGQIAKLKGCRVVGIAGGQAKVHHLEEALGFDAGIDHRSSHFAGELRAACPRGIDVYFDNVGAAVRDTVWPLMNLHGRIVVCGQIADYNDAAHHGPSWFPILTKRLTLRGFLLSDHLAQREEFYRDMISWYRCGSIRVLEDVSEGLDSVVPAFIRMLTGRNFGKTLIRL